MTEHEYLTKLYQFGFERVGYGAYADVFGHKGWDYVVKVGSGDQWPDYIEWAIKNGYAGTFAPKVHSLKFHDDGFYVSIMERLVATFADLRKLNYSHNVITSHYNELHNLVNMTDGRESWVVNDNEFPDLATFIHNMKRDGFWGDLHRGNIMLRKDGHPVIIDPSTDFSYKRLRIKNGKITSHLQSA